MKQIAWIGLGVMGSSMARHLAESGYDVSVYCRHPERTEQLRSCGYRVCASISETVADAEAVFSMVGYPADVEEVFLGQGGILESARPGVLAVDMTTSSPSLAVRLYEEGRKRGIAVLDAPVSGGDSGAKAATLSIMVGGDEDAFQTALPLFRCMGKSVTLMGAAGCGQHTKACNQICVAGATAAYTEALVYAKDAGLDPVRMLSAISGGAAGSWQIDHMAPRVLQGDLAPGFYVKHFIKDMRIIQDECRAKGVELEMLDTVLSLYEHMADMGLENDGTQALIKYYQAKEQS
jgi:3-hydroxyisobutyrate dehydrogenase